MDDERERPPNTVAGRAPPTGNGNATSPFAINAAVEDDVCSMLIDVDTIRLVEFSRESREKYMF